MPDASPRRVSTRRVEQLLADHGLSVTEFAERAHMDSGRLYAVLNGERGLTSLDLAKIGEAFGVRVEWLLGVDRPSPADAIPKPYVRPFAYQISYIPLDDEHAKHFRLIVKRIHGDIWGVTEDGFDYWYDAFHWALYAIVSFGFIFFYFYDPTYL